MLRNARNTIVTRKKADPQKAREQYAQAAFGAYARRRKLNKTWEQLDAEAKDAWCEAADEVNSAIVSTLDQEETFFLMLKLAMKDALTDDHISQLITMFVGRGGLPGKVRIIIAPEKISIPFAAPLEGKHDA